VGQFTPICLSSGVHAHHEVLMEVNDNGSLIVDDAQGIPGQQLRPRPLHLLNIIYLLTTIPSNDH
jgi:hypothetical protein